MSHFEDENNLNLEFFIQNPFSFDNDMDIFSDDETNDSSIPIFFLQNKKISFGFFEKSNNNFYEIISPLSQLIKIKHEKYLQISFDENEKNITYNYNIMNNYPNLIKIQNSNLKFFENENINNYTIDIIISFKFPPKILDENQEIISFYLLENYNIDNNLRCLDCPFRNILIKNINLEELNEIKNQIFCFCRDTNILIKEIKYLNSNEFYNKIKKLNKEINKTNNNDFYSNYITYANICQNLQKEKFESVISIYDNFRNNFKLKKYKFDIKNDKNLNSFFILKHISISPSKITIKKEMFHQSSRFLRLYYHNNNFIKIDFKNINDTQLYSNTDYKDFNKFSKISLIYDLIFKNGLNLCGKLYNFFLNPTNCMKSNSIWLLEENEYKVKQYLYYNQLGSSELLNNQKMSFSKILSRLSQNFTSTLSYNYPFEYSIIPDIKSPDDKFIFNDGCGKISKELMVDICNKLNKGIFSSAIQIRFKGAKGVLVVNDTIHGRKIELTESMVKYKCDNCESLEIVRFSRYSPGFLNLQIIILLILSGIKKKIIYSIAKKEVLNYRNYDKNNENLLKDIKFSKVLHDIEKQNKILKIQKDFMSKIAKSTYIYNRLCNISKKYRFHMKKCTFLMGVCDFKNILKENEVFIQICDETSNKKKIITGDVLITKNPCLSIYDLQKVKAVYKKEFKDNFYNIIIFPTKGNIPIPSKITGSDLDGDIYWICWDNKFLNIEKRDYSNKLIPLKNDEEISNNKELKYHINENGEKIRNIFFKFNTCDYNLTRDINNTKLDFTERCLDFHKFFHSNYKLAEVNKSYLTFINNIFKNDNYKSLQFNELETLEKLAFYHSIEVDFQKTGETSDFRGEKISPSFLNKNELRKKSNFLIRLKEINEEFEKNNINKKCNFYEYLINCSNTIEKEIYCQKLSLFEKQKRDKDMHEKSFIYKLYELISFFVPMQQSFINSIYYISEEYFYENQIKKKKQFSKFEYNDINIYKEILLKVKNIVLDYEDEIKYIMMENEISIEIELIYLIDFIEPKIPVYKNDIEDYRITLNEQIRYNMEISISKLNELKNSIYKYLTKDNIEDMIFILIFWSVGNKISINSKEIDVDDIIQRKYRIISRKDFINDLVNHKNYDLMKFFFYEHLKSFSLYNFYCNYN
jgi:hypothetical protein